MRRLALLAVAAALAGCGKGGDFSGDVTVPDGYATYRGDGVSFVHPSAFRQERLPQEAGDTEIRFIDPRAKGEFVPYVTFRVKRGQGEEFEGYVDSLATVFKTLGEAEIEAADVEVPGADTARRLDVEAPPKQGGNKTTIRSSTLVVRAGNDLYSISAGGPEDLEGRVDAEAIVESLRLTGGPGDA